MSSTIKLKSFVFLLLLSATIFSCKKEENVSPGLRENYLISKKVTEWFESQKQMHVHPAIINSITTLEKNLVLSNLHTKPLDNKETLITIPLNTAFQTPVETNKSTKKYLLLVETKDHNLKFGNVIEIIPRESFSGFANIKKISDLYNNVKTDLTGILAVFSLTNRFLYEKEYVNGILTTMNFLVNHSSKSEVNTQLSVSDNLVEWQLVSVNYLKAKNTLSRKPLFSSGAGKGQITRTIESEIPFRLTYPIHSTDMNAEAMTSGDTGVEFVSFLDEPGDEPDGYAPPIIYSYHATIGRIEGEVVEVIMDPTTAHPTQAVYINGYGQDVQRNLSLFGHFNTWVPLGGPRVLLDWRCEVYALYHYYDGSPARSRQWQNTKMSVK